MKRRILNRFDALSLGYFSVGLALLNLIIVGCLAVNPNPWVSISMAGFAMLGITEIAKADDPKFTDRHPWLMRLIFCSMTVPAFVILGKEYFANGLKLSNMIVAIIPATIAVAAFGWYLQRHGVDAANNTVCDETSSTTASNDRGEL
jgi:hypothetical protein